VDDHLLSDGHRRILWQHSFRRQPRQRRSAERSELPHPADRGKQVGGNLFHSFGDFNLIKDDVASFQGPSNVQNILARVTGGGASSIDGTLRSEISGANLYFINPAGVMFGANAKLEISGSFAVTTADYLQFGDGARFHAQLTSTDSLTSAPVSAFGFLNSSAAHVRFNSSKIATSAGKDLSIVAGRITLDAATVAAPSGRLVLASTAAAGRIPIVPGKLPDARGAITLKNKSSANINGRGGGSVVIRGGKLQISGASAILSQNNGTAHGGNIDLRLAGKLTLDDGRILATAVRSGAGGNIRVRADEVAISGGGGLIGSTNFYVGLDEAGTTPDDARGAGGDIVVQTNDLAITSDGEIYANTFGLGKGGSIHISADRFRIDGETSTGFTGVAARADVTAVGASSASGDGGDIIVQSNDLAISGGGQISTSAFGLGDGGDIVVASKDLSISGSGGDGIFAATFGHGDGGNIQITADRFLIDGLKGNGRHGLTGVSVQVGTMGVGRGGDIVVKSSDLTLLGGGAIDAGTFGHGDGGNIQITADRFLIDGEDGPSFTGISAEVAVTGVGRGGGVMVQSGYLALLNGGGIDATTDGQGDGGNIHVTADRFLIDGPKGNGFYGLTGVSARVGTMGVGRGGDIVVQSDDFAISNGGEISASTFGHGDSGSVLVDADRFVIDGARSKAPTGISAQVKSGGVGKGGDIVVQSNDLTMSGGGKISAGTLGHGDGGSIQVSAERFRIDGENNSTHFTGISARVATPATGRGGDVFVQSDDLSITGGGQISASSFGHGDSGSIRVSADGLRIDGGGSELFDTGIFASLESSGVGHGGDIVVQSNDLTISGDGGEISATTFGHGDGGTVLVDATHLRITGSDPNDPSGIFASSRTAFGDGGSILVRSDLLDLAGAGAVIEAAAFDLGASGSVRIESGSVLLHDDASVSVLSTRSSAGSIDIAARERIELHGGSSITASAAADGGSIFIKARDLFYLDHSSVVATAGTVLALGGVGSRAAASGGDITVDPTFIILDHATISANAALGRGGNILLVADNFFSSSSALTATGSTSGTVEIAAPELDLAAGLVVLPGTLVDASTQLREQCAQRLGLDFSSFLVIGRGGVSLSPDEALPSLVASEKEQHGISDRRAPEH
jgi:filamentous hemagglutinin family protein